MIGALPLLFSNLGWGMFLVITSGSLTGQAVSPPLVLTATDAKSALIGMVEASDDDVLPYGLEALMKSEPRPDDTNENVVFFNLWRCDLRARRFTLSINGQGWFRTYSGTFERQADGKWVAKAWITQRACVGFGPP